MKRLLALLLVIALAQVPAVAADDDELIEMLLTAVGDSDCVFIRNGKEHSAEDAEEHLRMKYRRGRKHVKDAATFISRIATKSSMSGKLYRIRCGEGDARSTADWLNEKLKVFRND